MSIKKRGAPATDSTPNPKQPNHIKPKPATKQETCLLALLNAGTNGLNTLEANGLYGETALHSMISMFRNHHKLIIGGERETVTCRVGTPTQFVRYKLSDEASIKTAKKLIDTWRKQRNATPLFSKA